LLGGVKCRRPLSTRVLLGPRFDKYIKKWGGILYIQAEHLSEHSLHPVTFDRVPELPRHHDPEPVPLKIVFSINQDKTRTLPPPPFFEQPGYLAPLFNLLGLAEPQRFPRPTLLQRVGDRQALAALGAPGAEHLAAVGRRHPLTKPVLVGPLSVGRLKCPLHETAPYPDFSIFRNIIYEIYITAKPNVKFLIFNFNAARPAP
jgi:hypothetical protein